VTARRGAIALSTLLVASAAVLFQLPVFDRTASLLDEGHILQFADLVHRGGELYRDAVLLPLPGAFYLLALAFDAFGPSILVARWILVLEFAAFAVIVYLLMRRLAGCAAAWAGVGLVFLYKIWAFPHWHMYSYSTTAQLCLAAAVLFTVEFHRSDRRRWLALAGLASGLAVLCKQDYGAAGLVAANGILWLSTGSGEGRRGRAAALAWYNGPVLAVGALLALHFLRQGLFVEMLQQTLLHHLSGMATGAYTSSALYRSVLWDTILKLLFYGPYLVAMAGAVRAWRRRRALRHPGLRVAWLSETTLVFFACASIAALNRPVDWVHVAVLYWPFLLLALLWTTEAMRQRPRAALVVASVLLVPAVVLVGYSGRLLWLLHDRYDTPLHGSRAGVLVTRDEGRVIDAVVAYMRAQSLPGEKVAVLPYFPLLSFLAERDAPHRELYTLWPLEYDPDRQRQVIRALESDSADVLVYHFTQAEQLPRLRQFAPELFGTLVEHWEIDRVFSDPGWGYMMAGLRRSPGPPPGTPLLPPDSDPRLHVEGPDGARRPVAPDASLVLRRDLWPFRPVLALEPSPQPRRTVLTLPLEVPAGARLRTAVGVDPLWWFRLPPSWVEFSIHAVEAGVRTPLFTRRLDPHRNFRERGWLDVELDLAAFSGRRIELELATRSESESGSALEMGGFEVPRLVVP
jgi:PAS domain-containing protein